MRIYSNKIPKGFQVEKHDGHFSVSREVQSKRQTGIFRVGVSRNGRVHKMFYDWLEAIAEET